MRPGFKFFYFLLAIFTLSCTVSKLPKSLPQGDDIIYSKNYIIWGTQKLSWKDFQGKKRSKKFDGGTFGGISFSNKDNQKWKAFAYFDKTLSWHGKATEPGLVHEEYHFNIVEIFARQLRKTFAEGKLSADSTSLVNLYVGKIWEDVESMQNQYDKETDYSRNIEAQRRWQIKIDSTIKSLDLYSNINIE